MHEQQKDNITPLNVFISYAHKDRLLYNQLMTHLSPLEREGIIISWYDGKIAPGTNWSQEIDQHLSVASLILLLVSPDFIASEYCYSEEMQRAMERHKAGSARVIPLLLRPVHWERTPFATLQALPANAVPVTRWTDRDEALREVAKSIREVVTGFIAQQKVMHDQQIAKISTSQKAEQEDVQEDIQPAVTWRNMIQQILSNGPASRLSNHERKILHSFLRVIPSLELNLLLDIWKGLGEELHQKLFLAWRQFSNAERISMLSVVEKWIDAFGDIPLEDRRDGIEILMGQVIASSLDQDEAFQSSLEAMLEEWNEKSEEERREEIDDFMDSLSRSETEEELIEGFQEMIREKRNSREESVQILKETFQEWADAGS